MFFLSYRIMDSAISNRIYIYVSIHPEYIHGYNDHDYNPWLPYNHSIHNFTLDSQICPMGLIVVSSGLIWFHNYLMQTSTLDSLDPQIRPMGPVMVPVNLI